eukprot:jgi/Tetstr1/459759/TSEL_005112.t1
MFLERFFSDNLGHVEIMPFHETFKKHLPPWMTKICVYYYYKSWAEDDNAILHALEDKRLEVGLAAGPRHWHQRPSRGKQQRDTDRDKARKEKDKAARERREQTREADAKNRDKKAAGPATTRD